MTKKEVKDFLNSHRDLEFSQAKLEYSKYLYPSIDELSLSILEEENIAKEDEKLKTIISNTGDSEKLVDLMRKKMPSINMYNLRQKLLANENMIISMIKEKSLTTRNDVFIENALYFFLYCKENVSDWIMENYDLFKSEYLKSMFCLVLGFKGKKEYILFLMNEADRLEKYYPNEAYDQGPALAVQELACRFLN